jgi:hypothetical protein
VEPEIALSAQSGAWSWAFAGCGLAVLACGWHALGTERANLPSPVQPAEQTAPEKMDVAETPSSDFGATRTLLWILLPACSVVLFMGVTNELCLDVASIPFLWIVPLAIYLITFIVCFGADRLYRRGALTALALLSAGLLIWAHLGAAHNLTVAVEASPFAVFGTLYLLALFFSCMLLHGELYRLRPSPERLTAYYLCISGGGALGGLFVAIVAPQIFSEYYELPFGWLSCLLLSTLACLRSPGPLLRRRGVREALAGVVGLALVTLSVLVIRATDTSYIVTQSVDIEARLIDRTRNFFSILRVLDISPDNPKTHQVVLKHGTTSHGSQLQRPDLRRVPVSYFGKYTGMGVLMHGRPKTPMHVGIIGLGAGTLAAYGREGDRFQFYEIDPDVIRIARDDGYFSYIADSRAAIQIIAGDARLSLKRQLREGGSQNFDLFIVDAFSSDSIPIHLITLEAMELYDRHLMPNGVLVVHISNTNLDLSPLVFRLAARLGMRAARIANMPFPRRQQASADWMVLSRDAAYIESFPPIAEEIRTILKVKPKALTVTYPEELDLTGAPLWTDDYSDLFSVLKIPNWKRLWASPEPAERDQK